MAKKDQQVVVRMHAETREKLKVLYDYFGRSDAEVVRHLIEDYYDAVVGRGQKRPPVGTEMLSSEFIQDIRGLIEITVPRLEQRLQAAEEEIRDNFLKLQQLKEDG